MLKFKMQYKERRRNAGRQSKRKYKRMSMEQCVRFCEESEMEENKTEGKKRVKGCSDMG
jgi:hypothetical protein